ncbi:hypothetical protein NDU88_004845 [Pleurodeles waltl]|uniref:Uncharacterized protein n=1 Tax=Pleurodeles waltl TaxID=8319 RepID=A0AAV7MXJ5_PLEWA|nr:hypothetical protein NDU88_004845 [Pleurodeles waltl]
MATPRPPGDIAIPPGLSASPAAAPIRGVRDSKGEEGEEEEEGGHHLTRYLTLRPCRSQDVSFVAAPSLPLRPPSWVRVVPGPRPLLVGNRPGFPSVGEGGKKEEGRPPPPEPPQRICSRSSRSLTFSAPLVAPVGRHQDRGSPRSRCALPPDQGTGRYCQHVEGRMARSPRQEDVADEGGF